MRPEFLSSRSSKHCRQGLGDHCNFSRLPLCGCPVWAQRGQGKCHHKISQHRPRRGSDVAAHAAIKDVVGGSPHAAQDGWWLRDGGLWQHVLTAQEFHDFVLQPSDPSKLMVVGEPTSSVPALQSSKVGNIPTALRCAHNDGLLRQTQGHVLMPCAQPFIVAVPTV